MNSLLTELSAQQLRKAAAIKERIDDLQEELSRLIGAPTEFRSSRAAGRPTGRRKHRMSAAGRAAIAAATRARWAKLNGGRGASDAATQPKRRRMSAATKRRLAAVARERWKKARAAGKNAL